MTTETTETAPSIAIHDHPDSQVIELHLYRAGPARGLMGYVLATWRDDEYVVWRCWVVPTILGAPVLRVEAGNYFGPHYEPERLDGTKVTALEQARKRFMERAGLESRS